MSAHQSYAMYALDSRLLGIRVLDPDCILKLSGRVPAEMTPAAVTELEKGVKSFHGYSRSGWFCVILERLVRASGVSGLDFLFDTPEERQFQKTPPDLDLEDDGVAVWYAILAPEESAMAADGISALLDWCFRNAPAAAEIIECYAENVRPAIERAHTLRWWTEVGDPEEVNERYFFCVLVTARDLLNCSASRRWSFVYELEEVH